MGYEGPAAKVLCFVPNLDPPTLTDRTLSRLLLLLILYPKNALHSLVHLILYTPRCIGDNRNVLTFMRGVALDRGLVYILSRYYSAPCICTYHVFPLYTPSCLPSAITLVERR
jgi:hypothetical protein